VIDSAQPRTESLIDSLTRLQGAYSSRSTETDRACHAAIGAVLDRSCWSPVVLLGVENLRAAYVGKHDEPDAERAARYLAECWAEHTAATTH
jgi:hypothetical protein